MNFIDGECLIPEQGHLVTVIKYKGKVKELGDGAHTLKFRDNHHPEAALGQLRYAVYAGPGMQTLEGRQDHTQLSWEIEVREGLPGDPTEETDTADAMQAEPGNQEKNRLLNLLQKDDLNVFLIVLGLFLAMGMGALHALSPGHGKAMVAAYLVGTQGKMRDAIVLGATVTLTHVGSVLVFGCIALMLSKYILPQLLYPWHSLLSGLLIAGIGCWMLVKKIREKLRSKHTHHHHHHHHYHHEDHHVHVHSDHHEHGEGHHSHSHLPQKGAGLASLISLGISGGMVPCPSALVVLLAAVALHRLLFGIALIVAFSLGLAAVLITIGILLVKSSDVVMKRTGSGNLLDSMAFVSASVIIIIGIGITYSGISSITLPNLFN